MSSQEKVKEEWKEIIIGEDKVEISDSTKLLGVTIDSDQKWSTHFRSLKSVQIAMNKMVRMLDGVSLKEHITSESLLKKYMLPSVNQLSAEIKMVEA